MQNSIGSLFDFLCIIHRGTVILFDFMSILEIGMRFLLLFLLYLRSDVKQELQSMVLVSSRILSRNRIWNLTLFSLIMDPVQIHNLQMLLRWFDNFHTSGLPELFLSIQRVLSFGWKVSSELQFSFFWLLLVATIKELGKVLILIALISMKTKSI